MQEKTKLKTHKNWKFLREANSTFGAKILSNKNFTTPPFNSQIIVISYEKIYRYYSI